MNSLTKSSVFNVSAPQIKSVDFYSRIKIDQSEFLEGLDKEERTIMVNTLILEKLPEDNYTVLKYLTQFLAKVCDFFLHFVFMIYLNIVVE